MPPAIDSSTLIEESITIKNENDLESLSTESTLDNPVKKKPRLEKANGIPEPEFTTSDHIPLTTHTNAFGVDPVPILWSHPDPKTRGPVICTVRHSAQRNAIGAHQGSYCIYTGLAVAAGKLNPNYVPNLRLTSPVFNIGPFSSWSDPKKNFSHGSIWSFDYRCIQRLA